MLRFLLQRVVSHRVIPTLVSRCRRQLSFTFAGPKSLAGVMKLEKLENKSPQEIAQIWNTYHEEKENTGSLVLTGKEGTDLLARGKDCQFFVLPVFRGEGHFMLVSQFQQPHFLLAYLEEYQQDPLATKPILTASVFDELGDVTLVRCDYDEKLLPEGQHVVQALVDSYLQHHDMVHNFNKTPENFHLDKLIELHKKKNEG